MRSQPIQRKGKDLQLHMKDDANTFTSYLISWHDVHSETQETLSLALATDHSTSIYVADIQPPTCTWHLVLGMQ